MFLTMGPFPRHHFRHEAHIWRHQESKATQAMLVMQHIKAGQRRWQAGTPHFIEKTRRANDPTCT